MARALQDGESRIIRKRKHFHPDLPFDVVAHRVDCDTPYVILRSNPITQDMLTDSQARELIDRLQRALGILPTSK
jgi:hypothetical protein